MFMDKKLYPLTNPQKSIYLTEQYYSNTSINNITGIVMVKQCIDFDKFILAIKNFVKQNDNCRLILEKKDEQVKQFIMPYKDFDIDIIDVSSQEELSNIANKIATEPFEIFCSYLFKFVVFRFSNQYGGFIFNMHHLIGDSWTFGIVINEIMRNYSSLLRNNSLLEKNSSYLNYFLEENSYLHSKRFEKDKAYWANIFSTIPENATIPYTVFPSVSDFNANRSEFIIDENLLDKINHYCHIHKISVFNFFMAIYSLYIGRVSNLEDFSIGTPILNRTNFQEKNTAGMFINTLPLRININSNSSFEDFAMNIANQSMGLLRHQKYYYQYIIEDLRKENSSVPNLYNIIISYQITKMTDENDIIPHESSWCFSKVIADDMDIHLFDFNDTNTLTIAYDYRTCKYKQQDVLALHQRIIHLIEQVLAKDTVLLRDLEIITQKEKKHLLYDFNSTKSSYPSTKTVIELFEEQVKATPDNIAVVFEGQKLSYIQLSEKVNELAHYLYENGIGHQDVVGLFFDKSLEVVISILAILKCNAIYLPIDIEYPIERIKYIIEDANAKTVLLAPSLKEKFTNINIVPLIINLDNTLIFDAKYANFALPLKKTSEDLAYIMYTSGSTGKPKGSMIMEKSIIRLVKNTNYISIKTEDHILQAGSIVFDACTFELWGALLNGASVYLIPKTNLINPPKFHEYLVKNKITTMFLTVALFNQLAEYDPHIFDTLKYLLVGGDALSVKHIKLVRNVNASLHLINGYGPTENTTFSTYYDITSIPENATSIPIGTPISNSTCYVVSPSTGQLQPIDTPGELWVGGDGVGKGYLNRAELTSSQFIPNPFSDGFVYKTGDLVEWSSEGNLNFIGRIDNQVKIRGFRIELSEIDSKILTYPKIKYSITVVHELQEKKYICSYFVSDEKIEVEDLKNYLKNLLPNYMIPHYAIQLEELPLTINAKIDRKKLPIPELQSDNKKIVLPKNEIETEIYTILSSLLNHSNISITDDFLDDLEMDSLSIMAFSTKLSKYQLEIQDINNFSTIEKLSQRIKQSSCNENFSEQILENVTILNKEFDFHLSTILLTGSNGFLGSHLLRELLLNPKVNKIYCLVRKKKDTMPNERLHETITNYFDTTVQKLYEQKVTVIDGNFEEEHLALSPDNYRYLTNCITTVIHCGANVKHYGKYNLFYNANVLGTQNMIQFCKDANCPIAHISTLSVGGFSYYNTKKLLDETQINIDQKFKNQVYMITKYKAECEILKSIANNEINGKIFRLGNIMPRSEDGLFQNNIHDNAFLSRIHTIKSIKCLPTTYQEMIIDISPVDFCAKSIITLLNHKNNQTIYHIYNPYTLSIKELLELLEISINTVSPQECILEIEKQNNPFNAHLLNDLLNCSFIETPSNNDKTVTILKNYHFVWKPLDRNYLNYINQLDVYFDNTK